MKLMFKINFFNNESRLKIIKSIPGLLEDDAFASVDCRSNSDLFDKITSASVSTPGLRFWAYWDFTKKELSAFDFFKLQAKKVFYAKDRDFKWNLRNKNKISTTGKNSVTLLNEVHLTNLNINSNQIVADDAFEEFYFHEDVLDIFRKERFTGVEYRRIINTKNNKPYETYYWIYVDSFMPQIHIDETVNELKEGKTIRYHIYGCLTYDLQCITKKTDFCRTSEPLAANEMPLLLVSNRVRGCILKNKITGVRFYPVFDKETDIYKKYLSIWEEAYSKISKNMNNELV